ncbi:sugar transferase [Rhodobacteraceae bacterium NNCM2]|nr:sugar transferase [Coraliihabitans acroporae]
MKSAIEGFPLSSKATSLNCLIKRGFDLLFGLGMLLVFSPLFALIAMLVFIRDPGPIFYSQNRVGKNGKQFRCMKFRSMVRNADKMLEKTLAECPERRREWNEKQKLTDDPRIIRGIGTLLRRTSLDELPQILNIIRGDMSVVGPRPVLPTELDERYGQWKSYYLLVKPGLTGQWQITGRSDSSYDFRIKQDVYYVRNWSLQLDFRILVRTVLMFTTGKLSGAC